jgi:hypothetical protein
MCAAGLFEVFCNFLPDRTELHIGIFAVVITSFHTQNHLSSCFHWHRRRLHDLSFLLVTLVEIFIQRHFAVPLPPFNAGRSRSVGIVIRLRIEGLRSRRSMPGTSNCPSPKLRAVVGINQGTRDTFLGRKTTGHELDHLNLFNPERMNARRYTSTPPHVLMSCCLNLAHDLFTFYPPVRCLPSPRQMQRYWLHKTSAMPVVNN